LDHCPHGRKYAQGADGRLVKIAQVGKINLADRWTLSLREDQPEEGTLVVGDDREEGTVNPQPVVAAVNEAQLLELIQKDTDSRPIRIRDSGIRTVNVVPLPFDPRRVSVPSSTRARSRMPMMPRELWLWTNSLVVPFPLSFTVNIRSLFLFIKAIVALEA